MQDGENTELLSELRSGHEKNWGTKMSEVISFMIGLFIFLIELIVLVDWDDWGGGIYVSDKRTHEFNAGAIRAANRIKSSPSAQPQSITCDGCKHVGTYDTDFPCSSCIRREKDYYEPEE